MSRAAASDDAKGALRSAGFGNVATARAPSTRPPARSSKATGTTPAAGSVVNRNASIAVNYSSARLRRRWRRHRRRQRRQRLVPASASRSALTALAAVGAVGAGAAIWGIGIERYLFTIRVHELPILPAGRRADPRAAPLRRAHGAVAAPQAGAGSPRSRRSSPTSSSTRATTSATPRDCAASARAFDPLRGIPGVFVHGSNDHAAPSPRNPLKYFTGPSHVTVAAEPLDTGALDGYLTDELGWLDLNNAVGDRWMSRAAHRRVRRERRAPRLGPARRAARPARGAAGRRAAASSTLGVTHAPYRRVLDTFTDLGADAIFAGHTHGGQVRVPGFGALVANCDIPLRQARGLSDVDATAAAPCR